MTDSTYYKLPRNWTKFQIQLIATAPFCLREFLAPVNPSLCLEAEDGEINCFLSKVNEKVGRSGFLGEIALFGGPDGEEDWKSLHSFSSCQTTKSAHDQTFYRILCLQTIRRRMCGKFSLGSRSDSFPALSGAERRKRQEKAKILKGIFEMVRFFFTK